MPGLESSKLVPELFRAEGRLLAPAPAGAAATPPTDLSLEELERRHIQQVLGDSTTLEEAAARLGINATTLWRKRKRYGLD